MGLRRTAILLVVSLLAFANHGCEREIGERAASEPVGARETVKRPNIILVIWDTARADRMSVYGHSAPTTPFLDEWSRSARVFERCVSAGNQTSPTHASIFTGYWPAEHGVDNEAPRLAADFTTLAELLRDAGYDTYMFADNPRLSRENGFSQGFDVVEHPWSPAYREQVHATLLEQVPPYDQSSRTRQDLLNPKFRRVRAQGSWCVVTRAAVRALARATQGRATAHLHGAELYAGPLAVDPAARLPREADEHRGRRRLVHRRSPSTARVGSHVGAADVLRGGATPLATHVRRVRAGPSTTCFAISWRRSAARDCSMMPSSCSPQTMASISASTTCSATCIPFTRSCCGTPLLVHYPERLAPGRDTNLVSNMDLFPTLLAFGRRAHADRIACPQPADA